MFAGGYLSSDAKFLKIPAVASREAVRDAFRALGAKLWGTDVISVDGKDVILKEPELPRPLILRHADKLGFDPTHLEFAL